MTTILHVEDNEFLADAVRSAFEAFGFSGRFLTASTISQAKRILADTQQHLDLVMTDMELPDGTGLDVVRTTRSSRHHHHVPVLILAGSAEASTVTRAYALGANSYITKTGRGRATSHIIRTVYDHWLRDVQLPSETLRPERTHFVFSRAISIRSRLAQQFMLIAERFGSDEGDFWMGVAQREGNMANLLAFLLGQLEHRELPGDLLDELDAHQTDALSALEQLEKQDTVAQDDAFRFLVAMSPPTDNPAFIRGVGLLFPASPVATAALLDGLVTSAELASAQIESHSDDVLLRREANELRVKATSLRSAIES
jgi:CheY-like chemotaxis protein